MRDLLFLSQRIPFPPDKGDKIRSFHILRHLAENFRVHLGCFVDDPEDWSHVGALEEFCVEVNAAGLGSGSAKLRSLTGLVSGKALTLPYYRDGAFAEWVQKVVHEVRPDATFIFSSAMAQFVLGATPRSRRVIMDFVDVDSDKWRQYAERRRWPMSWVYRRESERLLAFDRRIATVADASVLVSQQEADLFRTLAPESADKIHAISNGIDADFFAPQGPYDDPVPGEGPVFVFTGAMDYWPNVDAVTWFADAILPRIRGRHPAAVFVIVGGRPTPDVVALGARSGIIVTGRVPDVRPYLARADVAVAPIRVARGIQNKVLEAMAMARPVVATPEAYEGITALPGRELVLADGAEAFADAVIRVLDDPDASAMGEAARQRAVTAYAWPAKLAQFDHLLA
jgi:sugar transferase (PEP-CTERM/EpsH1 system associated)